MEIENPIYRETNIEPELKEITDKTFRRAFSNQKKTIDSFINDLVKRKGKKFQFETF